MLCGQAIIELIRIAFQREGISLIVVNFKKKKILYEKFRHENGPSCRHIALNLQHSLTVLLLGKGVKV